MTDASDKTTNKASNNMKSSGKESDKHRGSGQRTCDGNERPSYRKKETRRMLPGGGLAGWKLEVFAIASVKPVCVKVLISVALAVGRASMRVGV